MAGWVIHAATKIPQHKSRVGDREKDGKPGDHPSDTWERVRAAGRHLKSRKQGVWRAQGLRGKYVFCLMFLCQLDGKKWFRSDSGKQEGSHTPPADPGVLGREN